MSNHFPLWARRICSLHGDGAILYPAHPSNEFDRAVGRLVGSCVERRDHDSIFCGYKAWACVQRVRALSLPESLETKCNNIYVWCRLIIIIVAAAQ